MRLKSCSDLGHANAWRRSWDPASARLRATRRIRWRLRKASLRTHRMASALVTMPSLHRRLRACKMRRPLQEFTILGVLSLAITWIRGFRGLVELLSTDRAFLTVAKRCTSERAAADCRLNFKRSSTCDLSLPTTLQPRSQALKLKCTAFGVLQEPFCTLPTNTESFWRISKRV